MGTLDDMQAMRRDGKGDSDIIGMLHERGLSEQEITAVMSQSKIKEAVQGNAEVQETTAEAPSAANPSTHEYGGEMSASVMSPAGATQEVPQEQEAAPAEEGYQGYAQPDNSQQHDYSSYAQPAGIGSDVITEIADQVVAERLAPLTNHIDKIIDMRSTLDSQMRFLDERLKRLEKIIDRLQLSLLQRVGEYVSNVEDIKTEITETQKTFKALLDKKDRVASKDSL
jgi:hypothetical protein